MQASPQDRLWPTLSPPALALHLSVQTQRQALPLHQLTWKKYVFPCAHVYSLLPFTGNCVTVLDTARP